ncbi:MAG: PhnD/SsuA/transferrin family substrate-binding protein [Desulfuromonadales bacterium]|nr:PhnD/SsuA/transferrin family substrate-binding protein [Desulfuromonadales bacterium]
MNGSTYRTSTAGKHLRYLWLHTSLSLVILLGAILWVSPGYAAAEKNDGANKVLRTGFLQRVFYDIDPRDAKAALEVQSREISRSLGLNTPPQVLMFADMTAMTDALRLGELELATMPTVEYLRIRDSVPLIPSFVAASNNGQGTRYVVIARKDSGIRSFSDLKGKVILLPPMIRHELSHIWLDVLLMKTGKGNRDVFFKQVKESPKVSHAIMAIFLRQANAAIITRAGLDTSRKLNPQLETQLTVLTESRNLSDGITCLIPTTPEKFRDKLSKAIFRLNDSSGGRHMFSIFQSSGIAPFKPTFLEGLEELLLEYNHLKLKVAKRK